MRAGNPTLGSILSPMCGRLKSQPGQCPPALAGPTHMPISQPRHHFRDMRKNTMGGQATPHRGEQWEEGGGPPRSGNRAVTTSPTAPLQLPGLE